MVSPTRTPEYFDLGRATCASAGPKAGERGGLRLDRPAPGVDLKKVLDKLKTGAPDEAAGRRVLIGGPVQRERGFVLHTDDWLIDDASVAFAEGLAMTGTREALLAMVDPASGPNRSVLLLGYAGWGEGQLEDELGENVWLTADADPELIFDADYDGKWARALAGLGVDPARLSGQSGRAWGPSRLSTRGGGAFSP